MTRRHLFGLLLLSFVISGALAVDEKADESESDKKDEKTVAKRGVFQFSTHGHVNPAIISASHYHLPAAVPLHHHHKHLLPVPHVHAAPAVPHFHHAPAVPHFHHAPAVPHFHAAPAVPHVHHSVPHFHAAPAVPHFHAAPAVPHFHQVPHVHVAPSPHYNVVPGGATVTSYNVNYPRVPYLPRPVVPFYHRPAFAPVAPAVHPSFHHHHSGFAPHYHPTFIAPKPIIPVAVPFPGIRQPKYPVFVHPKPVYPSQFYPIAAPQPTFVPIPVPSQPQPAPPAVSPGQSSQGTDSVQATHEMPQIPMPTQPTYAHPTLQMRPQSWRPLVMMTQHHPQATQPTFTDKQPPYNYHAPAMAFNHDQTSSTNVISGHGQMSSQFAQQLALYQHQQQQAQYIQQQQQQENSFPYPAAAETFPQSYDQASNDGRYQGLSSYQVPIHH